MKFYRNQAVEDRAAQRLAELERLLGSPLTPPIPIDTLAEQILGLNILWEQIEEHPGEVILGAIQPKERLVILNERRRALFSDKPGLERFTLGHEMGHWDLFIKKGTLDHPTLPGFEDYGPMALRSSPAGELDVLKILRESVGGEELLRRIEARADEAQEARAVNRYAGAILMPRRLLEDHALATDRTEWRNLYPVAERFGVTITALRVRLEQLGLLYVSPNGELHESRDSATGQRRLPF